MLALMCACSAGPRQASLDPDKAGLVPDPVLGVADTGTRCTIQAMMNVWQSRADQRLEGFAIGPGDEVILSVPEIEELQNQHARISQDDTISLPLIGTVQIGGLDEDQARAVLSQRLSYFMKRPRLEMYVERYRSRGVAVAGAVQKPGVYDLASFDDSLSDMIAMAGGLAPSAAETAIFLPAEMGQPSSEVALGGNVRGITATGPNEQVTGENQGMLLQRISITLPLGRSGDEGCLNMPARPGDVILIPTTGNVTVVGWVRSPGSYPISHGMSVLGAVTAAGGALFSWHAEVMRRDQNGSRVVKRFSLSQLETGRETDIPVEAGDVVLVEKSVIGAVPYSLKVIFDHVGGGVGMGIPFP